MRFTVPVAYASGDDVQIEIGSTSTAYEPFRGNTVTARFANINIWDEEWENGYLGTSGQTIADTSSIRSKNYIPILQTKTYYAVCPSGKSLRICSYNANKTFISYQSKQNNTFTLPAGTAFVKFSCYGYGETYNNNISINYPSTYTSYYAYSSALAGTVYTGTYNFLTGALTATWAAVDGGSLEWTSASSSYRSFAAPTPFTVTKVNDELQVMSSAYKGYSYNAAPMSGCTVWMFQNSRVAVRDKNAESTMTAAEFGTYVTGQTFLFKLTTPLTYTLSPQQFLLLTGKTQNNVWSDAGQTAIRFTQFVNDGNSPSQNYQEYLQALRGDFVKLAKLEFLNPNGNVAFALDNNPLNKRSGAFIQSGTISCNLQNGRRRQASVTLHNLDHAYEFAVNHIWFGQQIRLSEGMILPDGTEFYITQGVFEIESPAEALKPGQRTVTYNLVDKWANLDGTHFGNLEDVYSVEAGTNIMSALAALLKLDRYTMENNGANPIDGESPILTNYYNDKTQTLTDGTVVSLVQAPYDFLSASTGTLADVVLGLTEMIAGDVGYNQTGHLVVNPSQDDIADQNKPILWEFTENDKTFLGADYTPKPADVYNDVIVVGATSDENVTARGRAQNLDPASDTCVSRIGRKTIRLEMPNYYSDDICEDYAMWQLKRYSTMSKSVTVTCSQMFHIVENQLITVQRSDKPGSPIERHVVQGFSRPIGQTGTMTINCISTEDYPNATLVESDLS